MKMSAIGDSWINEEVVMVAVMSCIFFVGTIGHLLPVTRGMMLFLTPLFLFGMGLFVIHPLILKREWKLLIWAGSAYLVTFTIEAIGVWTGRIFGEYEYGSTLGPGFFSVPLVIGFNWVVVVMGATELARMFIKDRRIYPIAAGAAATAFDVVLEPVAMEMDYWDWLDGTIPVQNYVAWFVIATLMATSYAMIRNKGEGRLLISYLLLQTQMFLMLRIFIIVG
ncbi:MAG: carotenoid biosynthesis protein [Candidatus Thermoplasmatota archaeon]|nr:carotenoid biosynthesis protein [Candidatus Thermoplasmatota archaeon]